MTSSDIRQKFLDFFKARGHAIVPSSSLIPDDPSVLLTTAGMQQFKKYFTGELDFAKTYPEKIGAASIQKSFRTSDIDEVGDESHLTFFEMLGNFSFGGYFKKEAIGYAHEFITKEMGLEISHVTIFGGDDAVGVPKDKESRAIWKSLDAKLDIREEGMDDVFWGPTGNAGPCGPTTEIYCKNAAGQDVEVWNIVFNQYFYSGSREELNAGASGKKLEPLRTPGVDTGMGLERLAMIVQGKKNIFETDLFAPIMALVPEALPMRITRIVADHARAASFLLADGVRPSNKEAGYVLRRLMRRAFVYEHLHHLRPDVFEELMKMVIARYGEFYPELAANRNESINAMWEEHERFGKTLGRGIKELEKLQEVSTASAFTLYESYGLPFEVIRELGGARAEGLRREDFDREMRKHQAVSRAGAGKKFSAGKE